MLTNIIYLAVFIILVFVLSIAVKAITRGVEAKQIIKDEKNLESIEENQIGLIYFSIFSLAFLNSSSFNIPLSWRLFNSFN